jgi:hypothetical protein
VPSANNRLQPAVLRHQRRAANAPLHYAPAGRWTTEHEAAEPER